MTEITFSSLKLGISVRNKNGSVMCTGQFEGADIKTAIPLDGGARCVILLDPDSSSASAFENLVCVDREGATIWRAKLPTSPDVYVAALQVPAGILGKTWSGMSILLDPNTGRENSRSLVK